jgi:tetratricopeptide (TPR) repeat protein
MLPDFCRHRLAKGPNEVDPAETARYKKLLGPTFLHIHHYCFGLAWTNRAKLSRMTPRERNYWLGLSIQDFDYVIRNASADFVLLPEILTKRGENLLRLRRFQEAASTLLRAIETKPDYWPPYAVLSDYHKQNGELDKAREWLEKGIAASPDAKALEMRQFALKNTPPPHSASTATKAAPAESKERAPASEGASE